MRSRWSVLAALAACRAFDPIAEVPHRHREVRDDRGCDRDDPRREPDAAASTRSASTTRRATRSPRRRRSRGSRRRSSGCSSRTRITSSSRRGSMRSCWPRPAQAMPPPQRAVRHDDGVMRLVTRRSARAPGAHAADDVHRARRGDRRERSRQLPAAARGHHRQARARRRARCSPRIRARGDRLRRRAPQRSVSAVAARRAFVCEAARARARRCACSRSIWSFPRSSRTCRWSATSRGSRCSGARRRSA